MLKILIADDEPLAREELMRMLKSLESCDVVAVVKDGAEALKTLKSAVVDAVFLDIEMPGMNGLETASRLAEWPAPPFVIFATAYDQYAVKAFEANAVDYLLKPYDVKRLEKTIQRIKDKMTAGGSSRDSLKGLENDLIHKGLLKKLACHKRNAKDRIVVDPGDVYFLYVQYTEVIAQLAEEELMVSGTLKELLDTLEVCGFAQTHKSYAVNLNKVQKVSPMFSGNFELTLSHSKLPKVPLSRRYASAIKARLAQW
ncbi:MAG: response regulator transcription factor [Candidatus Omnitrophica bacterium]|nr:response regulator transcription factor [Candidatus Omnitrophota bacterium]